MIGNSIYSLLSGSAPLTALVGSQIYPVQAAQTKKDPMVIYGIVKQEGHQTKTQTSAEDWIEIDLVVYAKDYDQMHDISKKIRTALDGVGGLIAGNEISKITFQNFVDSWEEERESYAGISTYLVTSAP